MRQEPYFGRDQVRSLRGVVPGRFYFEFNRRAELAGSVIRILEKPLFYTKNDMNSFRVKYERPSVLHDGENFQNELFLSDKGVLPYKHGSRNEVNFLLRTRAKSFETAQRSLKKKIKTLKTQIEILPPNTRVLDDWSNDDYYDDCPV